MVNLEGYLMRFLAAALIAAATAVATPYAASAWEPPPEPPPRFLLALRLTGLRAGGSVSGLGGSPFAPTAMKDVFKYSASIAGDAALRIGHGFAAGVYAELGLPRAEAFLMRGGLQAIWEQELEGGFRWWGSLGAGYERLEFRYSYIEGTLTGIELCNLKAGADFAAGRRFTIGPYLGASVGQYWRLVGDVPAMMSFPAVHLDQSIENRKAHYWFGLGLRGAFAL